MHKCSLQKEYDIFKEFSDLSNGMLEVKVRAWMGMRHKVRKAIQEHRNAVHMTIIHSNVIEGKFYV